jgi:hypothetical protein
MKKYLFYLFTVIFFGACSEFPTPKNLQTFTIDVKEAATLIGENGTLLYIPKGAFLKNGKILEEGDVTIELSEALGGTSIIENKLSTNTEDGKMLETVGMIYFNATADDEQLDFNKKNPSIARIPSTTLVEDVQVFSGVKSESGAVVWEKPEPIENKPTLVSLDDLVFYFENENPHERGHEQGYLDEPIQKKLIQDDGRWSKTRGCGLDNAIVKQLYDKKFEKTLISTIEFEERMKLIHSTCSDELIKLYIVNLEKNLWEIDLLAADYLDSTASSQGKAFRAFAKLKLTRPDGLSPISAKDIHKAIEQVEKKQKEAEEEEAALTIAYSVSMTEMGWINCDRFLSYENTIFAQLNVKLNNLPRDVKPDVYLIFNSINSLLSLDADKKGVYYLGFYPEKPGMEVPKDEEVLLISYGLDGSIPYIGMKTLTLGKDKAVQLTMEEKSLDEFKEIIQEYFKPKEEDIVTIRGNSNCCGYHSIEH